MNSVQTQILSAIQARGPGKTICPSEVARAMWPEGWRERMDEVRAEAAKLVQLGTIEATQRGHVVDLETAVGPIRLRGTSQPMGFPGRLALCCQFAAQPISFRTTTATSLLRLSHADRLRKLSQLCRTNAESLLAALQYCAAQGIRAFRIISTILPIKTHPQAGYTVDELPERDAILETFGRCRAFSIEQGIRLSFHPDQFVVLNSPRKDVVENALADLVYHTEVAEWLGADVINIHGGGAFGDKPAALARLRTSIESLPTAIRARLTLENDDHVFTPEDLLPVCRATQIPLVYDVHHHRCLKDSLTIEAATEVALQTWNREPLFHISSPLDGWTGPRPERHHDFIDPADFPDCWRRLSITVDVEAKAKEAAVLQLQRELTVVGRRDSC